MSPRLLRLGGLTSIAALLVAGCAVGPDHVRPSAPVPASYKEAPSAAGAT